MKNKVCFVCIYFGEFPNYFEYWLQCCKNNPEYSWLIVTDNRKSYDYPDNVTVQYISLAGLKNNIESLLSEKVNLEKPYKLCDYKPLYGEIFKAKLSNYTHWGYMDFDLIFGDLNNHFTDDLLEEYDKVSVLGHVTVIKNTPQMIELYKKCDYISVLQNSQNRTFDELMYTPNINQLIVENGLKLKPTVSYADIGASHYNFYTYTYHSGNKTEIDKYVPTIFLYRQGKAYQCSVENGKIQLREIAYFHFSRRKIEIPEKFLCDFYLIPNSLIDYREISAELIMNNSKDNMGYFLKQKYFKIKKKIIKAIKKQ